MSERHDTPKRGKSVSRSVYQKKAEEAKRLNADLKSIVQKKRGHEELLTYYTNLFAKEDAINNALRDYARNYFRNSRGTPVRLGHNSMLTKQRLCTEERGPHSDADAPKQH